MAQARSGYPVFDFYGTQIGWIDLPTETVEQIGSWASAKLPPCELHVERNPDGKVYGFQIVPRESGQRRTDDAKLDD